MDFTVTRWDRRACAVFHRTRDRFGGLSNMAGGYPLSVGDVAVPSSEALYHACRFPGRPDVQAEVLAQASPMAAKMVARANAALTRDDWPDVRVPLMAWSVRVKLACNWRRFSGALEETGGGAIVEQSGRDQFWGAVVLDERTLLGANVLGRLLADLRTELRLYPEALAAVDPPDVDGVLLLGAPVGVVLRPPDRPFASGDLFG